MRPKRSTIIIFIIVLSVFILTQCIYKKKEDNQEENNKAMVGKNVSFGQFAGSAKCANCHKNIFEDHIKTGHYLTSQPASEKSIKGSFVNGKNKYVYNPNLFVAMEKRDSGFYQVVYYKGIERKTLKFGMAIGSGARGQSFAYWQNHRLFQLPITYYSFVDQWANSPGFPDKVQFDRPITSRCLECHSTFANTISPPDSEPDEFNRAHLIYGVDCEKCHGPGGKHVEFQLENPKETKAKYIINPSVFTRQQKLDLCALCHGGNIKKIQPSFAFTAGDTLSDYFVTDTLSNAAINFGIADVHGNQYELLKASKCFKLSKDMTCNSCHNTHENERGKLALFSRRCMTCHNNEHENFSTINNVPVSSLKENCIDCHMPAQPSKSIVVFAPGAEVPTAALFRSHFISIYPGETKKLVESKKKSTLK